jgi:predicted DCC family thiol-disulfide oxidoreductase YuxK
MLPRMAQGAAAPSAESLPERVVFYDGVCAFCNGAVRWLIERDARGRLHYAPLQGETARTLRALQPERFPADIDTMVYAVRESGGWQLWLRSRAALHILEELDVEPLWRTILRVLPRPLADLGYRVFAASRYRVFGKLDACPIPPPELRGRFLP